MKNAVNSEVNPSNPRESHLRFSNSTQSSSFLLEEVYSIDTTFEDNDATIIKAKQILYPSFFSTKGLAQDILEVTQAEPDVPLNTFITLSVLKDNKILKDYWIRFVGTTITKGILHSPEHLMGGQTEYKLFKKLPQQEEEVFKHFKYVIDNINDLEQKVTKIEGLDKKESILMSLSNVRDFYIDYKGKVLKMCQTINQKKNKGKSIEDDLHELSRHLEHKAIMFGELLPKGPAYRIPRDIARHILSLANDGTPLPKNTNVPSNHRVSSLPYHENPELKSTPRVYFKANGSPSLQPGEEVMLSSFYRLLNIPVPQTGLLVITGMSDNNPAFLSVQASEAVIGESPKSRLDLEEELGSDNNYFLSFCQQVLGAILTNPGDGKPDNFIYHKEKYGLVSIDNDEIFVDEFSILNKNNDYSIKTKSLLFCMKAMDRPIPKSLSNFLTTLDPQLLVLTWLTELYRKNQEYQDLESVLCFENARQSFQKIPPNESPGPIQELLKKPITFDLHSENFLKDLSLPIKVSKSLLDSLQTKLSQIAKVLLDNQIATSQELLDKISPPLGFYYKSMRNNVPDPIEAILKVWEDDKSVIDWSLLSSLIRNSRPTYSSSDNEQLPEDLFSPLCENFKGPKMLDRFVEKYGERRKKGILQPEEALREMLCLLRMRLTSFEKPQDVVDFWYKGRREIKGNVDLIEQWDAVFFALDHAELKWLFELEKHFSRGWKNSKGGYPTHFSEVKGAFTENRCLSEPMINEIFDKPGAFKEIVGLTGRSKVARFPKENPIFYFKKLPEIPGYDYASTLFMRSLGLQGVPFSELFLFRDTSQGLYSTLVTQAVAGNTLEEIWHDDNNFSSLDPHHTFLLILCSILINPEDGKGDNYILTPDKRRIIPIDNDHVFLPGIMQEERGIFIKTIYLELQSKTVLYCLHEMEKPIPSSVAQIFTELDIDKFLDSWLKELRTVNNAYQALPPENYLTKAGDKGVFFRIAFHMDYIKNLYTKLIRMKHLLSEQSSLTPFQLLKCFEPFVENTYKKAFHEESTVVGRFMKVTKNLYKKDKNGHQMSRLNSNQIFKILHIPQSELVDKDFLCKQGPQDALEFLERYREQLKKQESRYQKVIRGETELKKTDLGQCTEEQEKAILDLAFKRNKEAIALHNSKLLDGIFLSKIFDSFISEKTGTEIRLLDLRGTLKLNSFCILLISEYLPNLEYLNLGYHPLLNSAVFLGVNFKKIKRLVVSHCSRLSGLIIESPLLDALEIQDNPKLGHVLLYTRSLTYFDSTASERAKIHTFKNIENLQVVKPGFTEMNKIENLDVIQSETDQIIEKIAKDLALEQCLISEKRTQEIKDDMPDIAGSLLTGPVFYLMSKALVGMVSFMINDSYEKRVEKLQPKAKEMINKMVKHAFDQGKE